jgi:hypothetical protein
MGKQLSAAEIDASEDLIGPDIRLSHRPVWP